MRTWWANRTEDREGDEGFTLIELMVVVLIIAILIAIAVPTFLGAREKAQERAAQSNLRNGFSAAEFYYADQQTYELIDVAAMEAIEPSLTWVAGLAPASGEVGVAVSADNATVCLTTESANGSVFAIGAVKGGASAGTYYHTAALAACDDTTVAAGSPDGF
jgi:type IV pilus assembly protein PilA